MEKHITKTLADLNFEIAARQKEINQLTVAKDALTELYGQLGAIVEPKPVKASKPAKAKRKSKTKAVRPILRVVAPSSASSPDSAPANGEEPLRVGSLQHRVLVECRKLPAPFTAAAVAVATGIEEKAAGNALYILGNKKLVEQVGRDGIAKTYQCLNG